MVQLAIVMRVLSFLCDCVKANSTREDENETPEVASTGDNVDGTEVVVTNTTVSNVTCCGARAANQNRDEAYSKTPVTGMTPNIEQSCSCDDDQSSNEPVSRADKRGSRIILEINSYEEYPEE